MKALQPQLTWGEEVERDLCDSEISLNVILWVVKSGKSYTWGAVILQQKHTLNFPRCPRDQTHVPAFLPLKITDYTAIIW